jgi:hypothetical protein
METKKRRGGKRIRRLKERFEETDLMKQANRRGFASGVGEYGDDSVGCMPCSAGQFSFKSASRSCSECPAGTYSALQNSLKCTSCPAGTFSTVVASSSPGSLSCAKFIIMFTKELVPRALTSRDCIQKRTVRKIVYLFSGIMFG